MNEAFRKGWDMAEVHLHQTLRVGQSAARAFFDRHVLLHFKASIMSAAATAKHGILFVFQVWIIWMQVRVVMEHTTGNLPQCVFVGELNKPLNTSCLKLFDVIHWTIFVNVVIAILEIISLTSWWTAICCLRSEAPGEFCKLFCVIWGLTVLWSVHHNDAEIDACHDIYACALWTYIGPFVFYIALNCICGIFTQIQESRKQEPNETTPLSSA